MRDQFDRLREICTEHPKNVPVQTAAEFDGIDPETLRQALRNKTCPFGYISGTEFRAKYVIPTTSFYLYHTAGRMLE